MAEVDLSTVFSDALSGAGTLTQQAGTVYQQAQNAFTSRREITMPPQPPAAEWANTMPPQSPYQSPYPNQAPMYPTPQNYSYGYGYNAPSGYNWNQGTDQSTNSDLAGFTSPTYGKGGY